MDVDRVKTIESEQTKNRVSILEAALDLFSEIGYHGTSIRMIARKAGVSEALIYHHFPDKLGLLTGIIQEKVFHAQVQLKEEMSSASKGELPDTLEELLRYSFDLAQKTLMQQGLGKFIRIMLNSAAVLPMEERRPLLLFIENTLLRPMSDIMARYIPPALKEDVDPYFLFRSAHGTLIGYMLIQDVLGGNEIFPIPFEGYRDQFIKLQLAGIRSLEMEKRKVKTEGRGNARKRGKKVSSSDSRARPPERKSRSKKS